MFDYGSWLAVALLVRPHGTNVVQSPCPRVSLSRVLLSICSDAKLPPRFVAPQGASHPGKAVLQLLHHDALSPDPVRQHVAELTRVTKSSPQV